MMLFKRSGGMSPITARKPIMALPFYHGIPLQIARCASQVMTVMSKRALFKPTLRVCMSHRFIYPMATPALGQNLTIN